MGKIRQRLYFIAALIVVSIIALVPRNVKQRVIDPQSGQMRDTTVRRVPINLGLDLQGGIHLALEVDQSKGPVPDCADAIQRAERVVRTRVDEFGTTEPVVQIQGRCRLIVELAGEKDPARARGIIQRTAFLEFRITDMKNQFKDALPQMDAALKKAGVKARSNAAPSAVAQLFGGDTSKAARDSAADANSPGVLSSLLFQGQLPGEYLVPEEQWPLVDSLVQRPDVRAAMPRGIELRWGATVESRGARSYRALYAVDSKPIITGEELTKAVARRDGLGQLFTGDDRFRVDRVERPIGARAARLRRRAPAQLDAARHRGAHVGTLHQTVDERPLLLRHEILAGELSLEQQRRQDAGAVRVGRRIARRLGRVSAEQLRHRRGRGIRTRLDPRSLQRRVHLRQRVLELVLHVGDAELEERGALDDAAGARRIL